MAGRLRIGDSRETCGSTEFDIGHRIADHAAPVAIEQLNRSSREKRIGLHQLRTRVRTPQNTADQLREPVTLEKHVNGRRRVVADDDHRPISPRTTGKKLTHAGRDRRRNRSLYLPRDRRPLHIFEYPGRLGSREPKHRQMVIRTRDPLRHRHPSRPQRPPSPIRDRRPAPHRKQITNRPIKVQQKGVRPPYHRAQLTSIHPGNLPAGLGEGLGFGDVQQG